MLLRNRSHVVAWVRRRVCCSAGGESCHSSRTSWEKPNLGIDCETKRKVKKEAKGGARDWIGFRSPKQDV